MTEEKKDLVEYNAPSPVETIKSLMSSGVNIKDVRDFLALQREWEKGEAEKAFNVAMSEFKKNVPTILKTEHVEYLNSKNQTVEYYHADLGVIVATLIPALAEFGFNHSWEYAQDQSGMKVTCIITHRLGHSKSNSLASPPDSSGGKNPIQAIGSTTTYLERYTFMGSLGLAAKGMDDDGKGANNTKPEAKKTVTPQDKRLWNGAINAYQRDGNFKKVLESAELSKENQGIIIYTCAKSIYMSDGNFDAIAKHEGLTDEIKTRIMEECR